MNKPLRELSVEEFNEEFDRLWIERDKTKVNPCKMDVLNAALILRQIDMKKYIELANGFCKNK